MRLTDVGAAMKNCISTPALASLGDGMGKAMEYAYVGAGVPMEGLMDSVTNQR
ncbi:MAG: hypothetical protein J6S61_02395 [Elusimicrobiaceae bacterium]|nr:hypothetical protein [Elusimicrobiaceae bacterium]